MTDKEKIAYLEDRVRDLEAKLSDALSQLGKMSVKKDSSNSSIPPSKDTFKKKVNSLRKKSDKPSGGQPGHKGSTLEAVKKPDETIALKPAYCQGCGHRFSDQELSFQKSRQVIDIPLPRPIVTEYHQYVGRCSCGCKQAADFPSGVNAKVQYGQNIEALVGYFSAGQYIPYQRMTELFSDLFSLRFSQGTVDNLLVRLGEKAAPFHQRIREEVANSKKPVGGDETGCSVNGKNYWTWVWQNEDYCYLTISPNRGSATVIEHFPDGFPHATLSSDRWAAHLKTTAQQHQICLSHLLRELNYLEALEKHSFSGQLRTLFQEAIQAKKTHSVFARGAPESQLLEDRLNLLLQETIPKEKYPQTAKLQRSLIKLRQAVFPFLYEEKLAADNNASERAIRNVKVKMKVSGMFKSGHPIYAALKSIIETIKKRGGSIFEAFYNMARTEPQWDYC